MIFVKMDGHDFQYEVQDMLKLFFRDEDVVICDSRPEDDGESVYLLTEIVNDKGQPVFRVQLKNGGMHFVSNVPMDANADKDQHEARKLLKREIKRQLYLAFSRYTRKDIPWGILTGIRPAKIVHELMDKGKTREEILVRLNKYYMVSKYKAHMLYDVAEVEKEVLKRTSADMISLYIGIPFCMSRCVYCSFTSYPIEKYRNMITSYIEALKKEMDSISEIIKNNGWRLQSIYIGGGTPTSIDSVHLKGLLEYVEKTFDLNWLEEYVVEAGRPDSIDENKLKVIKESRVNRISINPQSMNDETLKLVGRNHTAADIIEKFNLARRMGFDNINMDVIVGLPGENTQMFENTLKSVRELGPESLTVHTMSIKRASKLNTDRGSYKLTTPEEAEKMVELAHSYAKEMGMHPYYLYRQKNILGNLENIGYCKPGCESIYNIQIMEENQTIAALGAGAVTKKVFPAENRIERAFNVKGFEEYIERIDEMIKRKQELLGS